MPSKRTYPPVRDGRGMPCRGMHATARLNYNGPHPQQVVLFGRSLGGAVAAYAATRYKRHISGLVIENTFTRIVDIVPHTLPILRPLVGPNRCMPPLVTVWLCYCRVGISCPIRSRPTTTGCPQPLLFAGPSTSWCATTGTM